MLNVSTSKVVGSESPSEKFQVLQSKTNNSTCSLLNAFKYCYLLLAHRNNFKHFYLIANIKLNINYLFAHC